MGKLLGPTLGSCVGSWVGIKVGTFVGTIDGSRVGALVGSKVGYLVGAAVGADIWLGRLVFSGSYGRYVFQRFLSKENSSYIVFGARYFITDHLALNAKAFIGHFPAGGLAYRF